MNKTLEKYMKEIEKELLEVRRYKELYSQTQQPIKSLVEKNYAYEKALKKISLTVEATNPQAMIMKGYAKDVLDINIRRTKESLSFLQK